MRLKPEDKEKIRQRILGSAAAAFRARGIEAVTLDDVMAGAGLTRGAFYAHFKSKAALLEKVLRHEHPIHRMLRARTGETGADLRDKMRDIFSGYLDPANLAEVHEGCTLAALTADAARAPDEHRVAYEAALMDIAGEMARGQDRSADDMLPAMVQAAGAVTAARACDSRAMQTRILTAAREAVLARIGKVG